MAWTDIDFALIKTGMITKGTASVSFADYLNEFSTALDERLNMLIPTEDGSHPTLPNITFLKGELRVPSDNDFWTNYRSMVTKYYDMWAGYNWYTTLIMTDPVNFADYTLADSDLIAVITQETFDIISDVANHSNQEIFTADVINSLYEIYKLTFYTTVTSNSTFVDEFKWAASTVNFLDNIGSASGQNDQSVGWDTFSAANTDAYSEYNSDYGTTTGNFSNNIVDLSVFISRRNFQIPDDWRVGYDQSENGISLYSRYRDLNDVLLDMDVTAFLGISENYKQYQLGAASSIIYGAYDTNFAQVGISDPSITANATPLFLDTNHQTTFGTVNTWAANGGSFGSPSLPKKISVFDSSPTPGIFYDDRQFFNPNLSSAIMTNINNSGLEFFITP